MSKFFERIKEGLKKTSRAISLKSLFEGRKLDEDLIEELEDSLIGADLGPSYVAKLIDSLNELYENKTITETKEVNQWLRNELIKSIKVDPKESSQTTNGPAVWMFLGVNGVGKTTSLGKLAKRLVSNKFKIILAAGDTFRAAAGEQLALWAQKTGSEIVRHNEGGDPSAVVYDALEAGIQRKADYVLIDTAGRLHNKKNLMAECQKIFRTIERKGGVPEEIFLVVDASTGQNAVQQAIVFSEVAPITGIILTKMDGTAKGGVAFRLVAESGIPIRYIGVGENEDDLIEFNPEEFVDAILPPEIE
jgi:fused signal recognition particle receptor